MLKTKLGRKSVVSQIRKRSQFREKNIHERSLQERIDPADLLCSNAVFTTTIRLRFDARSTACQRSEVTR